MTRLVLKMSLSLDGFTARTDGSNDWIFPSYTPDAVDWTVDTLRGAVAHLMGSTTYRAMAEHWPNDRSPFAPPMNDIPKIVFSTTLTRSIWGDTTFLVGDLVTELTRLKEQRQDGYLLVHGGARFARALCRTGLIDELRLLVHPVVLGEGERIFAEELELRPLATTVFTGGAVGQVSEPARASSTSPLLHRRH